MSDRSPSRLALGSALLLGALAVSSSAILSRVAMGDTPQVATAVAGMAPALAVAFWRCGLGALALAPLAWRAHRRTPVHLTAVRRRQLLGSGVALGLHFGLFQASLALTTVASATTLATMSPLFVALGAWWFLREPTDRRTGVGMAVTVVGALTIGAGDLAAVDLGVRALIGDGLAFGSAVAVSGYLLAGRAARRDVPATVYSCLVYAGAAAVLLVACLAVGVPLIGFSVGTWLAIALIVVGPQLLGHSVFNALLEHVPATVISTVVLSEPIGAALLAWLLLDELPAATFAVGAPLVLAGVAVATLRARVGPAVAGDAPVATDPSPRARGAEEPER
ncbi:DMT family transporter [Nitriliruptor alkaliphilus]|uniref:DMT family transporter n=1 Tax=Nitriliruptor alkaliphilus TaxID=427918 RepID=UPI00069791B2|nr:DMT family transporter [Nitriliruptor alkaliphilus]